MIRTDLLASGQIISRNPVLGASRDIKRSYFSCLKKYIRLGGWERRMYVKAQLHEYAEFLLGGDDSGVGLDGKPQETLENYRHLLPMDIAAVLGYQKSELTSREIEQVTRQIAEDFHLDQKEQDRITRLFAAMAGEAELWNELANVSVCKMYDEYLGCVMENLRFMGEKPYRILITATMSAGKSTLINALVGKNICAAQNMACTSNINLVIGKAFDDGRSYEYSSIQNGQEQKLYYNKQVLSAYYDGGLGGKRFVIYDSPGVNFSENTEHRKITERFIENKEYDCLVYLMNATQLGTNDDEAHLEFVKKNIGRKKILFVINKIDTFNPEEEDMGRMIEGQKIRLREKGFPDPAVCVVSARAALLAKKNRKERLGRVETRELHNYMDKFEIMGLDGFYGRNFQGIGVPDSSQEETQLLKNCGMAYLENIIAAVSKGTEIQSTRADRNLRKKHASGNKSDRPVSGNECQKPVSVYVLGAPSSGKSTLVNAVDWKELLASKADIGPATVTEVKEKNRERLSEIFHDERAVILYVLNGRKQHRAGDEPLLSDIAECWKNGGKRIKERVFFVINKLDNYNGRYSIWESNIGRGILGMKSYLAAYGMKDVRIFPVSAYAALCMQRGDVGNGYDLMLKSERNGRFLGLESPLRRERVIEYEYLGLEQYITFPPDEKRELEHRLSLARNNGDIKTQALIHCGLEPLGAAVKAYVDSIYKDK